MQQLAKDSSHNDGRLFVRSLFIPAACCRVGLMGLKHTAVTNRVSLCMGFLYSKKKIFPDKQITMLLGSPRLLPWKLPVNILGEFSH